MKDTAKGRFHSPLLTKDIQFIRQGKPPLAMVGTGAPQEMFSILDIPTSRWALWAWALLFLEWQSAIDPFDDMETFPEHLPIHRVKLVVLPMMMVTC